jgi:hypothetical protein
MLTDGFYLPVLAGSAEESDVEDAVDLIRRDLNNMAVEELLECICTAQKALVELGILAGQSVEGEPSDGEVNVGPDEQYPDQASYYDAKCNAANAIYDTVLGTVQWLETNNLDLLAGVLGGMTTALGMGLLISGPVGWAVSLAAITVVGITTYLLSFVVDFSDLEDALVDVHTECVLSLFNASNTLAAKSGFIAEIAASSEPTTSVERDLAELMLSSDLLNLLFDPRQDVGEYESPVPIDCGAAILQVWSFVASGEGWSFRDDSDSPYSASGVWSSPKEAWEVTIVGPGTGTGPRAEGTVLITGLSIAVPAGSSVQMDHSATGDGVQGSRKVKVFYSDVTDQTEQPPSTATAGTVVLTVPVAKTISEIEISFGRNWAFAFNTTRDCEEVRVIGT